MILIAFWPSDVDDGAGTDPAKAVALRRRGTRAADSMIESLMDAASDIQEGTQSGRAERFQVLDAGVAMSGEER